MIYFNNAATSYPKPPTVIEAVNKCVNSIPVDPHRANLDAAHDDIFTSCRKKLAQLFHADNPDNIAFTSGATHSINLIVRGLDLNGAHVITTAIEHSAMLRALKIREHEDNVSLTILECDQNGVVPPESIENAIRDNTAAIFINHASNTIGSVNNIERIAETAQEENLLLIVDAAQSAGCIPIDIKKTGIDVLIFTGHKSLYGVSGIGGFYVNGDIPVKPLIVGGTGIKTESLFQTEERPAYFESGTHNILGITALEAGVSYILENGLRKMNERKAQIYRRIYDELQAQQEITLYGKPEYSSPIISFNIKGIKPKAVGYLLGNSYNILVRTGLLCAPLIHKYINTAPEGTVRISFSYHTTDRDVDELLAAIKDIIKLFNQDKLKFLKDLKNISCY